MNSSPFFDDDPLPSSLTNCQKSNTAEVRYAPQFKQKVINYVVQDKDESERSRSRPQKISKKVSYSSAAKEFKVHPTTISDWVKGSQRQGEVRQLLKSGPGDIQVSLRDKSLSEAVLGCMQNVRRHLDEFHPRPVKLGQFVLDQLIVAQLSQIFQTNSSSSSSSDQWAWDWWSRVKEFHGIGQGPSSSSQERDNPPQRITHVFASIKMKSRKLLEKSASDTGLTDLLNVVRFKSGSGGGGRHKQGKVSKKKTRKELRKEERRGKKLAKHNYFLEKYGKKQESEEGQGKGSSGQTKTKSKKKRTKKKKKKKRGDDEDDDSRPRPSSDDKKKKTNVATSSGAVSSSRFVSDKRKGDKELEALKKEMSEGRKRRLLEENEEEDKFISRMEKRLKLNKKTNKITTSFREDGLDYVLELCQDSRKNQKIKPSGEVTTSKTLIKKANAGSDDEEEDSEEEEEDLELVSEDDDEVGNESGEEEEEETLDKMSEDEDDDDSDQGEEEDMLSEGDDEEEGENSSDAELEEPVVSSKKKKEKGIWEDIYGRMRRKDGTIIDDKDPDSKLSVPSTPTPKTYESSSGPQKYVPPILRRNEKQRDKILRSLKGLMNRLSESNMSSISKQMEDLYMENSRNEMNECLLELLYASLLKDVIVPERLILENVMLISILHANVGVEIGAFFLQKYVERFKEMYDANNEVDNKRLENLLMLISALYHFKVVDCCLIYDILQLLSSNFETRDIQLILALLRTVGFRLRKDDPIELKNVIILIQQKANENKSNAGSSAYLKFMLEIVTAIRNNNMSKIPNYDPELGDHLRKLQKSHLHKGNYVSTMKLKMADLLNAETKGRWWIVGSAWSNVKPGDAESSDPITKDEATTKYSEKLLTKARTLGMNTDSRRAVFCILMTAEDYLDAFSKLDHLGLQNNQTREIIHVAIYCCLHEKKFNPYYALVASKFCTVDRKYMYPPWFKKQIVEYASLLGQRQTSRLFCISQRRVFEWIQCKYDDDDQPVIPTAQVQLPLKSTKQVLDCDVEHEVYAWVQSQLPVKVSSTEIRNKAKELYRLKGHLTIQCSYGWYRRWTTRFRVAEDSHEPTDNLLLTWILQQYDQNHIVSLTELQKYGKEQLVQIKPGFKGSAGWATRFFKRHHLLLNWHDMFAGPLPPQLEAASSAFLSHLTVNVFPKFGSLNVIGCMDEVPLSFSEFCAGSSGVLGDDGESSSGSSRIKKYSISNCDATVILTLLASGTVLPPFVIIRGQNASDLYQTYSQGSSSVVTYYCSSTEPTLRCLEKWYEEIWDKEVAPASLTSSSLLFVDDYHLHHQFQEFVTSKNRRLDVEIFPEGCSSKLQPLNAVARRLFLKSMEEHWSDHLKRGEADPSVQLPKTDEIIQWVSASYEKLKEDQDLLQQQSFSRLKIPLLP